MGKKKVNPRRRPATMADVDRAKAEATAASVGFMSAVVFTVLHDKEGYEAPELRRVIREISNLSESLSEGYVSVNDLLSTLLKETGVNVIEEI